jgi:methylmalonyl-CoA mutase, N-terminal domain
VESLTAEMEKQARDYIRRIDEMGGMIPAIERGFPQTEIANASYEYQHSIETGEQKIVGVNAFTEQNEEPIELLEIDASAQGHQLEKLTRLKASRDNARVRECLDALRRASAGSENTMPHILEAVRAYATVGEICDALREVFGAYTETSVL